MSNLTVEQSRALLRDHFTEYQGDKYGEGWAKLWDKGDFLPWDRFAPNPALAETLLQHQDLVGNAMIEVDGKLQRKKALVPGCGRGVDVLLLESFGYDVVGLEYSETAVKTCIQYAEEHSREYVVRDEKIGKGSRKYVRGDFYKTDWLDEVGLAGQTFHLIYDYTFFCAMDPKMRPAWAMRMSELLGPAPQANLICLEFPTKKPVGAGGPPYSSPPKVYMEHLSHPGEDVPYDADGNIKLDHQMPANPKSLERVGHWTPKDSHKIGRDEQGQVMDFIAIWRHR